MSIEFVRCPYCFRDVEVNSDHEVDVCYRCYEVIKVKDVLKKRRLENILSHAPGPDGENKDPAAEMMAGSFWKYTKTMDESLFNQALEYAERLLSQANTAEERYAAINLVADIGARAVAALIDKHCLGILFTTKMYNDELQEIWSRMDYINRVSESKGLPFDMNAGMMMQTFKKSVEKKLKKKTEEISQRQIAAGDAAITRAMEEVLRYYEKLSSLACTDSLLSRIADMGYGLQMSDKHRKTFGEIYERMYGRYKPKERLFEGICRETWPMLPAEITGWKVERRQEDGAILVTITRTVSEGVKSITYDILPLDAKSEPLFSKPVPFTQDAFIKDQQGRVESNNTVCTLPPIPNIHHFQIRMKTVNLYNGMEFTARDNAKVDVDPAPLDDEMKAALKAIGGERAQCLPCREGELWRCICGKYNPNDREECLCCKRDQDDPLHLLNTEAIADRAKAIRVDAQNMLLKPYEYKGLACRCGGSYFAYNAKEGQYEASEQLKPLIGEDLPVCTALDTHWLVYIDARSRLFKVIDLSTRKKLAPFEYDAWDMAYENGTAWICGEELASYDPQTGKMDVIHPGRARKPRIHHGTGFFLDMEDRLQAIKPGEKGLKLLAKDVHAFVVEDDTLYIAAGDRILCAKVSTAKGLRLAAQRVLARDVDAEKLALDETNLYYYTRYLGKAGIQRLGRGRKGGKMQKAQTVYEGAATCLYTDQGKAYALTDQNELLCLSAL